MTGSASKPSGTNAAADVLARARAARGASPTSAPVSGTTSGGAAGNVAASRPGGVPTNHTALQTLLLEFEDRFRTDARELTAEILEFVGLGQSPATLIQLAMCLKRQTAALDNTPTQDGYLQKIALRGIEISTDQWVKDTLKTVISANRQDVKAAQSGLTANIPRDKKTTVLDIQTGGANAKIDALNAALSVIPGQPKAKGAMRSRVAWLERVAPREDPQTRRKNLHVSFVGPDEVGQPEAAGVYAKMLHEQKLLKDDTVVEIDLAVLVADHPKDVSGEIKKLIEKVEEQLVLFTNVDSLDPAKHAEAIAEINKAARKDKGPIFVFSGEGDAISAVIGAHPQLQNAVNVKIPFVLHDQDALFEVLNREAEARDLLLDRGAKLAAQGRLIGKKGDLSLVLKLLDEAEMKLADRTYASEGSDAYLLTAADFEVDDAGKAEKGTGLERMQKVIGLQGVKDTIAEVVALAGVNKRRQLAGKPPREVRLHATFEGNPGTGKSTIAETYHRALMEIGQCNEKYVLTKPSELKGDVVGAAATQTNKRLKEAKGGMFVLDEAHQCANDPFGEEIIRTVLTFMEENPDTVVIFAGYPDQMWEMLTKIDPGLMSRLADRIKFPDYSDDELMQIADLMAKDAELVLDPAARELIGAKLRIERSKQGFGNARDVRNLIDRCVRNQGLRLTKSGDASDEELSLILPEDVPGGMDKESMGDPLEGMIGLGEVRKQVKDLEDNIVFRRDVLKEDPRKGFEPNYQLVGPPGTGKSTVAGALGQILYKNQLLGSSNVVTMASNMLLGLTVGEAKKLTLDALQKASGGVLVLDEISGLLKGHPQYRADVIAVLLDYLEKHRGELSVCIAGYEADINAFIKLDPGLSRRFGNRLNFEAFTTQNAVDCFGTMLNRKLKLDTAAKEALPALMQQLHDAPAWSSAGDVRVLAGIVEREQGIWYSQHRTEPGLDFKQIPQEVLELAFAKLIKKKNDEAGVKSAEEVEDPALAMNHDFKIKPKPAAAQKVAVDVRQKILQRLELTVQGMGLSPDDALDMIRSGKVSVLAKKLAEDLGMDPDTVAKELESLAEKVEEEAKLKPNTWICMFCGSNNPSCPYKGLPDREQYNANKTT